MATFNKIRNRRITIGNPSEFRQPGRGREKEQHSDRRYQREDLPDESVHRIKIKRRMSTNTRDVDNSHTRRQNLNDQWSGGQKGRVFGQLVTLFNDKVTKENSPTYGNRKGKKGFSGRVYSDDSSSTSSEEEVSTIITREQLNRAVLSRDFLENNMEKPMFIKTIIGCYVRLKHNSECKVFQIVDHYLAKDPYKFNMKMTKIILNVKHGSESYSSTMNVVSNQPISPQEFHKWIEKNRRDGLILPTLIEIAKKQVEMKKTSEYAFTESDVENLIKAKGISGQNQKIAHKKVHFITKREIALDVNDMETVAELDKQIEMMEQARAQEENTRENRKLIPGIPRVSHVPTLYRHDLPGPSGSKRTLADRVPKSYEPELEKYVSRKYKRSSVQSRRRVETDEDDWEEASLAVSKEIPTDESDEEKKKKPYRRNRGLDLEGLASLKQLFPGVKFKEPTDEY